MVSRSIRVGVLAAPITQCEGLIQILKKDSEIEVILQHDNLEKLLRVLYRNLPDILIVYLPFVCRDCRDFVPFSCGMQEACSKTRVLLITEGYERPFALWALKIGVKGLLVKGPGDELTLLQAVKSIASGRPWFDEGVMSSVAVELQSGRGLAPGKTGNWDLSKQEIKILDLVRNGYTNKEISQRLFISESTVKSHLYRMYKKLGVTNRVRLVIRGLQEGILE